MFVATTERTPHIAHSHSFHIYVQFKFYFKDKQNDLILIFSSSLFLHTNKMRVDDHFEFITN